MHGSLSQSRWKSLVIITLGIVLLASDAMAANFGKGVKILDMAKQEVELASLWTAQPVVLSLVRRFG